MKFMQKLNNLKNKKKGFTLVELIIVIVILAILAAILIPSFIGYVNKANNSQAQVEARSAYLAACTIAAEGKYKDTSKLTEENILTLAALTGKGKVDGVSMTNGEVTLTYTSNSGNITITLPGGATTSAAVGG